MNKEKLIKFLRNKWTLITAGVLVVVAAAGLAFGLNFNNWFGTKNDTDVLGEAKGLFWNVDRQKYVHYDGSTNNEVRLRDKTDGMYHVLFCAVDQQGRAVNRRVKSDRVMTKIDKNQLMSLVFDDDGIVIDCVPVEKTKYEIAFRGYVLADEVPDTPIQLNTDMSGAGLDFEFEIPATVPKYDISGSSGDIGTKITGNLAEGDGINIISEKKTGNVKYVIVSERSVIGTMYFNKKRMYNSTYGMSTREKDAEGYYNFELAYDGTCGVFKTKDTEIAKLMDSVGVRSFGLELEEGTNIIKEYIPYKNVCHGSSFGALYSVTSIEDNIVNVKYVNNPSSADWGKTMSGELAKNYKVMDCTDLNVTNYGCYTDLRVGDKIFGFYNARKKVCLFFVMGGRTIDSDLYWSTSRKWDTKTKTWTRTPEADGRYVFTLYAASQPGVTLSYWTRNPEIAKTIDESYATRIFGLKVSSDGEILESYSPKDVAGGNGVGSYYLITKIENGVMYLTESSTGKTAHGTLSSDVKIYNTQKKLKADKLGVGDKVQSYMNVFGEIGTVFIITKAPTLVDTHYCKHCLQNVQWYEYTGASYNDTKNERNHLIMTEDYIDASAFYVGNTDNTVFNYNSDAAHMGRDVVLDLAGHHISAAFKAISVRVGSKLTIMDSKDGGYINSLNSTNKTDNGVLLFGDYYTEINFMGGTIDGSNSTIGQCGCTGTGVYIKAGSVFNMYDGATVIGTDNTYNLTVGKTTYGGGQGGSVLIHNALTVTDSATGAKKDIPGATFNMYGGTITGGKARSLNKYDTSHAHCSYGGNVVVNKGSTFNMYGGVISNGYVEGLGGNVYINNATMNMYGGSIINGTAEKRINANGEWVDGVGGNIAYSGSFNIKGNPQISGSDLYIAINKQINVVGPLDPSVHIKVTVGGGGVFAKNAAAYKNNFEASEGAQIVVKGDDLAVEYTGHVHCVCGADAAKASKLYNHSEHSNIVYQPLTQADISGNGGALPSTGNYYLTSNVEVSAQGYNKGDLNLCYNGHTISFVVSPSVSAHTSQRILLLGYNDASKGESLKAATVTLSDCQGGGGMKKSDMVSEATGALIQVNSSYPLNLNMYGGKYDMSQISSTNASGGGIKVIGCTATVDGASLNTTVNCYNCEFIGCKYNNAGNIIYADKTAQINLFDGKYSNPAGASSAIPSAAGIYLNGTSKLNLYGKIKLNGTNGANINNANLNRITVDTSKEVPFEGDIAVTMATAGTIASFNDKTVKASEYIDMFKVPALTNYVYGAVDNELRYNYTGHVHCECGYESDSDKVIGDHSTHKKVYFQPLTQSKITEFGDKLPTSGDWYLAEDVTVKNQASDAGNINLCYNGHTVYNDVDTAKTSHSSSRMYILGYYDGDDSTVSFCDCQGGGGMVKKDSASTANGAMFYVTTANHSVTVNFYGGTYDASGITTTNPGGVILVGSSKAATVNIYEGTEFIGAKASDTANILRNANKNATVNIFGGDFSVKEDATVDKGIIYVTDAGKFNISGLINIPGNVENEVLYIAAGVKIGVKNLDKSSVIYVAMDEAGVFAENAAEFIDNFKAFEPDSIKVSDETDLKYNKPLVGHVHCVCGKALKDATAVGDHSKHEEILYQALTQDYVTTTLKGKLPDKGNWYLAENITVTTQQQETGDINLCFNGKTITIDVPESSSSHGSSRMYLLGYNTATKEHTTVNFTDCVGTGGIKKKDALSTSNGAIIFINASAHAETVNFFGGTFDASEVATTNVGGVLYASTSTNDVIVNVYDGTKFIGASASSNGNIIALAKDKTVLNIFGGEFTIPDSATVVSGIYMNTAKINVSGNPVISGENDAYIVIQNGKKIGVKDLDKDNALIAVKKTESAVFADGASDYLNNFKAAGEDAIEVSGSDLKYVVK